ncbi:enoyl-CoA hydratase/isomerase family protein [Paraburkholderia sp. MM5384-R2]|uniref:enoyl-CoA hydratase/isomerase family protein n=1 Tax=Paraburkholderia sp. MM5384-R2 TaxID=2723097 RepID=UPI001610F01D|nr:enoyl-CoA hydratase/isomerase family protein [Paraburkholderia sp. MM5384-R2]MBB5498662.1 enoyl-CoA hydratase/carnithine racemase [Paraburkholderia sp. MM5384-R2]
MSHLSDYQNRYRNIRFERRGGVLQMSVHTDNGPMKWGADAGAVHEQLGHAFHDVGTDPENKVVIFTGTGDAFCVERNMNEYNEGFSADYWYRITREGRDMLMNLLDIDVPVISAVNGPALIHSELCVLADIVLASETAKFRDSHIGQNVVPGDGCHAVWNLLLGRSRGHYYLLTAETLSAQKAEELGVVHEILSPDRLLARAWEIAETLARKSIATLRYTRMLFAQPVKESLQRELSLGLAMEGLSVGAMLVVKKEEGA